MLHQEAESFLRLPEPSILIALLWGQYIDLPVTFLPVNGALLQLVERKRYKRYRRCGYRTISTAPPVPVGGAMHQFYLLPGIRNPVVSDKAGMAGDIYGIWVFV